MSKTETALMTADEYAELFIEETPECLDDSRQAAIYRLASEMHAAEFAVDDILESADYVNQKLCIPVLPADSWRMCVAMATGRAGVSADEARRMVAVRPRALIQQGDTDTAPDEKPSPFQVLSVADFSVADLPDWLVTGAVVQNSVHCFWGHSGSGKTFITMDMAMCIATGRPWFGRDTERAAVLWVAAEDPHGVHLRALAWCDRHGANRRTLPFRTIEGNVFNLRKDTTRDAIVSAALELLAESGLKHVLIVVDTLARATPGADENSSKDVGEVTAAFDRLRVNLPATLCIIHHSGKDESRGMRGSSALPAGLDSHVCIKKAAAGSLLDWTPGWGKVKNGPMPGRMGFDLEVVTLGNDRKGEPVTSCIVQPRDMRPVELGPVDLSATAARYRDVLATLCRDEGEPLPWSLTGSEGVRGVPDKRWRAAVVEGMAETKASTKRSAWKRTRQVLLELGAVQTCDHGGQEYVFIPPGEAG